MTTSTFNNAFPMSENFFKFILGLQKAEKEYSPETLEDFFNVKIDDFLTINLSAFFKEQISPEMSNNRLHLSLEMIAFHLKETVSLMLIVIGRLDQRHQEQIGDKLILHFYNQYLELLDTFDKYRNEKDKPILQKATYGPIHKLATYLVRLQMKEKNFSMARYYLYTALEFIPEASDPNELFEIEKARVFIYQNLVNACFNTNDFKSAVYYARLAEKYFDKIKKFKLDSGLVQQFYFIISHFYKDLARIYNSHQQYFSSLVANQHLINNIKNALEYFEATSAADPLFKNMANNMSKSHTLAYCQNLLTTTQNLSNIIIGMRLVPAASTLVKSFQHHFIEMSELNGIISIKLQYIKPLKDLAREYQDKGIEIVTEEHDLVFAIHVDKISTKKLKEFLTKLDKRIQEHKTALEKNTLANQQPNVQLNPVSYIAEKKDFENSTAEITSISQTTVANPDNNNVTLNETTNKKKIRKKALSPPITIQPVAVAQTTTSIPLEFTQMTTRPIYGMYNEHLPKDVFYGFYQPSENSKAPDGMHEYYEKLLKDEILVPHGQGVRVIPSKNSEIGLKFKICSIHKVFGDYSVWARLVKTTEINGKNKYLFRFFKERTHSDQYIEYRSRDIENNNNQQKKAAS